MIPLQTNPMKDKFGKWRTYSLFYEHRHKDIASGHEYPFFWTLSDYGRKIDGKYYQSLKQIYLDYKHIPGFEYEFATEIIGSWVHWQRLVHSGLKGIIAEWKAELEIKLKAKSMKVIINTSVSAVGPSSLQAAKYLADKGYAPTRGRPSKAEVAGNLAHESGVSAEIEDDLKRVGLKIAK